MSRRRDGQGRPIDSTAWPADGKMRDWLVYCDQIHRANGRPSLSALAAALNMTSRSRISQMLRGLGRPADEIQARGLLTALGADDGEADRGLRKYRAACAEQVDMAQAGRAIRRPDWWLRSGYIDQVDEIAPLQLLDRDAELAELANWCTDANEAYVWWQAGPRSGKSAVMSWFVLHPPPGVWVVSFFVTARYTGQADSTAFTDELIDQLAAITGQQVPPVTSARERDRLRRQLFEAAVARAVKTGHRLVLLVDGLDEDCGSHAGSGLPSIARCLPKHPADAVRVVVAGRPDPPLPADIASDPDHPLHRCRVRRLAASPHARQVMQLAQDELDHVLATDTGLGYQVLGLVTASGGGLEHRDLHAMTGRPIFEIDRLLRGVFGRTIAGRSDTHAAQRVFLFTHETLRVQAIDRLGPHTLSEFRETIHVWAGIYQLRGWPADTPKYLLRGYARMLADTNDLDRLEALATDSERHHRMLNVTGGDAAALTEITTAQSLLRSLPVNDLAAALRLAWCRDRLTDRNAHVPTELPAVWAELGQPVRAEALARSIAEPGRQAQALAGLVRTLASAGDCGRAEQVAASINGSDLQAHVLADLAGNLAETGDHDRADQVACSITDPFWKAQALTDLVEALCAARAHDRAARVAAKAEQVAASIADSVARAQVLAGLVTALTAAGRHEHGERVATAAKLALRSDADRLGPNEQSDVLVHLADVLAAVGEHDDAEQVAYSITEPIKEVKALIGLTATLVAADEHERAVRMAAAAEQIAHSITKAESRVEALMDVAWGLDGLGEHDQVMRVVAVAEKAASSITHPANQAMKIVGLVLLVASVGEYDYAERITRSITIPTLQRQALNYLAEVLAIDGEHDRAVRVAAEIEQTIASDIDLESRAGYLTDVARILAIAGSHDHSARTATVAEQTARSITDPRDEVDALVILTTALAAADERDRAMQVATAARQIALTITDLEERTRALIDVSWAMSHTVPLDSRTSITATTENVAPAVICPRTEAHALVDLAKGLVAVGEHDRAARLTIASEQVIRSITDPFDRERALVDLVGALAASGEHDRAEQVARSITNLAWQAQALANAAGTLVAAGDHRRAALAITAAEQVAASIADRDSRARALISMAPGLTAVGENSHLAQGTVTAVPVTRPNRDDRQAEASANLAQALTADGEYGRAEQVARAIAGPSSQAQALANVAGALASAGEFDRAERIVQSITDPYRQAQALADLADAAEPARARMLIADALVVGRWTIALHALAHQDPRALSSFVDRCAPHLKPDLAQIGAQVG